MSNNQDPPAPVEGIEHEPSTKKALCLAALLFLLSVFGAILLWAKVTNQQIGADSSPHHVSWYCACFGILCMGVGAFGIPLLIRWVLVRRRIVIASDRFQLVETIRGEVVVVVKIPFENIAKVGYVNKSRNHFVGIDLLNPDDEETYVRRWREFKQRKNQCGWHYPIRNYYQIEPQLIAKQLKLALKEWRQENDDG